MSKFKTKLILVVFALLSQVEAKLVRINVTCNRIGSESYSHIGNKNTCYLKNVKVINDFTFLNGIYNENIEAVEFQSSTLSFFPHGLKKLFPNLKVVVMEGVGMTSIDKKDLKEFGNQLEYLNLYNNGIEILRKNLFNNNPNLKYINFGYTPLKTIESGFFENVHNLTFLNEFNMESCGCINRHFTESGYDYNYGGHMYRGNYHWTHSCKEIDDSENESMNFQSAMNVIIKMANEKGLYKQKESKIEFKCKSFNSSMLSSDSSYSCKTEIFNGDTSIDTISLENGDKISDMSELKFENTMFMFFPNNSGLLFAKLISFTVTSSGLVKIGKNNFESENLKILDLSKNILIDIPADAFDLVPNLEELYLQSNKLQMINASSFRNLNKLNFLNLEENAIKIITADMFDILPADIDAVSFSENNCIDGAFPMEDKNQLIEMILDNCVEPVKLTCEMIDETTCEVKGLNITYIKTRISTVTETEDAIATNEIRNLIFEDIIATNEIKKLIFDDQDMKFMPFDLSTHFTQLEKIVVNNSKLSQLLPSDFSGLSTLKTLEITNNNISKINENVFHDLRSLEALDLSSNEISSLPTNIFVPLINLKTLNLSHNKLTVFKVNYLPVKNSIESFDVSNNEIIEFESRTLKHLRKAKIIDLTGNTCIDKKFDRSTDNNEALMNLFGNVEFNCNI